MSVHQRRRIGIWRPPASASTTSAMQFGIAIEWFLLRWYLPGVALKSYLIKNRRNKLPFKVVIQLALDLARGLSYLHSQKFVHRDVKTENILLDKSRTLKIADFGVARVEASNPSNMTGETGTLGYMAPEVLNGNPYNRKCDVYSFGICLWEIYCCDMPYPDLSFAKVTTAVVCQLGAIVEEGPDYCVITPPPEKLNVISIDTYDDHRMAMPFSLAACADVPVTIKLLLLVAA